MVNEREAFGGTVRGTHLLNVVNYVRQKRGASGVKKLDTSINASGRKTEKVDLGAIQERDAYPYTLYLQFLESADKVCGTGDLGRVYDIGYQTIQHLGHLSYLARAPNIQTFVENAQRHWNTVYSFGAIEVVRDAKRSMVIRYHGFPRSRTKCEYFRGSLSGMLAMCHLTGTVQETACNAKSENYCEFTLKWE